MVRATCALHNLLRAASMQGHPDGEEDEDRDDDDDEDESGESNLRPLRNLWGNRALEETLKIRGTLRKYFISPAGATGATWQYAHVNCGTRLRHPLA